MRVQSRLCSVNSGCSRVHDHSIEPRSCWKESWIQTLAVVCTVSFLVLVNSYVAFVFFTKTQVGVLTMAGKEPELLVSPTDDMGKILSSLHGVPIHGRTNFAAGVQIAQVCYEEGFENDFLAWPLICREDSYSDCCKRSVPNRYLSVLNENESDGVRLIYILH